MIVNVYLAGPMRGRPELNFPAFHAAAADLRARGIEVFNPAEHEPPGFDPAVDEPKPLARYMAADLPAVCRSDAVVVLDGWQESQGASLEVHVARVVGVPVLAYPDLDELSPGKPDRESVLLEAERLVNGARRASYGHPADDYARTAALWTALLAHKLAPGAELDAEDAIRCMVAVKLSRDVHAPKRDNRVDLAGYAGCLDLVRQRAGGYHDQEVAP